MKTIDHTFGSEPLIVSSGNFFQLLEASADVTKIEFKRNGQIFDTAENIGQGYYAQPKPPANGGMAFDTVEITASSGVVIKVGISKGEGGTNSVVGSVNISNTPSTNKGSNQSTSQVSVSTTAVSLKSAESDRLMIELFNSSSVTSLYIGGSSVTTSDGYEIRPGEKWYDENYTGALYGIVGSGTITVGVREVTS